MKGLVLPLVAACAGLLLIAHPCQGHSDLSQPEVSDSDLDNLSLADLLNKKGTVSASKQLQKVSDAPANVIVVTHDQIIERGYMNVKDVLADLPGMETIENSFTEYGTLVPVRGIIGNNKILLLINGMPVNPPNREDLMLRQDQSVRFAQRVEIVYGPGSTLYGTDAVSAVINVITADPKVKGGEALASYGSFNTGEGAVSFGTPMASGSFQAYLQMFKSDSMNVASNYPDYFAPWQKAYDTDTKAGDETLFVNKKSGTNIFAEYKNGDTSFQYFRRESQRSSAPGYASGVLLYSNSARWKDHSDVARMENALKLDADLSLKTSLTYSLYQVDPTSQYVYPVSNAYFYGDNKYARGSSGILEQQLNWRLTEGLNFILGYEYRRSEGVPKASFANDYDERNSLTDQTSNFTYSDASGTHTVHNANEFVYSTIGVYAQGDWKIDRYLRAVAGVRYNEMSLSNDKPIVPRLSLISQVNDRLTVKLIHAQAFVYPALYFQYNVFDNGTQLNIANPNLKPEKSQTTELNFLYDAHPWNLNASVYYNKQQDIFLVEFFDKNSPGYLGPVTVGGAPRDLYQTTNSGDSTTYGIDTLTQYDLGHNNSAFLALSYVTGTVHQLGVNSRLDRISNENARLGLTYRLLSQKLTVSPRLSWRSDPMVPDEAKSGGDAKTSNENALFKDIYQLDLFASYLVFKDFHVFTRLDNLTNHKYMMRGNGGTAVALADTFSAQLGVDYTY